MIDKFKYLFKGNVLDLYFCVWSRLYLWRWQPQVIVITGSVGKTHLLDLLKFQLGERAYHSYKANTKIGITCNLLGLAGIEPSQRWRWLTLPFIVPFKAVFWPVHRQPIYLVEYDIASVFSIRLFKWWLKPDICVWVSATRAHLRFFDRAAHKSGQPAFERALDDFATLVKSAKEWIFALEDNRLMRQWLADSPVPVRWVPVPDFDYKVTLRASLFRFADDQYLFSQPLPKATARNLRLMKAVLDHLRQPVKRDLRAYQVAPSRHTVLPGIKNSFLIDSTYNSQLAAVLAMLQVLHSLTASKKWLVCGDMIEQGAWSANAHQRLAAAIVQVRPQRVFLIGRRCRHHVYPILRQHNLEVSSQLSLEPAFIADFKEAMSGREVILFKGSGYLYVLLKALLANPEDERLLHATEPPKSGVIQQFI